MIEQDTYITTTDQGAITMTVPKNMSPASVVDFEDWIMLVLRGMKRRAEDRAKKQSDA